MGASKSKTSDAPLFTYKAGQGAAQSFLQIRKVIQETTLDENGKRCDLRTIFNKIDTDGNGTLDRDEFLSYVKLVFEKRMNEGMAGVILVPESDIDGAFHHMDRDGNGVIDFDEFTAYFGRDDERAASEMEGRRGTLQQPKARGPVQAYLHIRDLIQHTAPDGEELAGLFRRVDTDSSGEIDKTEFAEFVRLCVENQPGLDFEAVPPGDVEAAFLHIDTDGGGTIDLEEFEDFFGMCDFLDHAEGYLTHQVF